MTTLPPTSAGVPLEYRAAEPNALQGLLALLGRVLMSVIFLVSGYGKATHWSMMAGFLQAKGLPMPHAGLGIATIIELGGGLLLLIGLRARWAALIMFLFLIPTSLIFHNFWAAPPQQYQEQQVNFLKNLAIMGGLLIIMSDWFYRLVYLIGCPAFLVSSSSIVLHRDRARRKGAYLLAPTHFSPYDVALLIKETPRILDFVSITEVFRHPLAAWFLGSMGAFPLDRSKPDSPTVRIILDRLARGRAVAMFPEGHIRRAENSVLSGGSLKPGISRIAKLAGVPIIPCVILGTGAYRRFASWLPVRRTRYAIIYGEPIIPSEETDAGDLEARLRQAYLDLYEELKQGGATPPMG